MVHSAAAAAAAAGSSSTSTTNAVAGGGSGPPRPFRPRLTSTGSFHAGDSIPTFETFDAYERHDPTIHRKSMALARRQSVAKYHTFPTPPPKVPPEDAIIDEDETDESSWRKPWWQRRRRRPQKKLSGVCGEEGEVIGTGGNADTNGDGPNGGGSTHTRASPASTPLPVKQLGLLALLSLAEQTALNSIGPYLPTMVASFKEIPETEMGLYVGMLASAFALAQLATNLFWGYLSDIIGRKPVIIAGSTLLMVCFLFFGFCTTYWEVVVVHVAMGLLNGNAAVVPTCLGEVTDRTNQSRAFTWLPLIYSIGSITGPALGGLLVGDLDSKFPFLAPNICSALLLGLAVVALIFWFDETLEGLDEKYASRNREEAEDEARNENFGACSPLLMDSQAQHHDEMRETIGEDDTDTDTEIEADGNSSNSGLTAGKILQQKKPTIRQIINQKTIILLLTYLVFQVGNISFNCLYPIFSTAPEPTGRDLPPGQIGLLLSFAGLATIVFQAFAFQPLKTRLGNLGSYRWALCGLAISMLLMPWVGHLDDRPLFGIGTGPWWLNMEEAVVLVFKNICAVGGLSSVMLLITNSAPSHETLGTLNGIAQTLSAAGRSVGPFLSGALFTLSTQLRPKGELLPWWIFGGVSVLGWLLSLTIHGRGLESADWQGNDDEEEDTSGTGEEQV